MKREWNVPEIEEVMISSTENGQNPDRDYDGPWEQLPNGQYWRPGSGTDSQTK